VIPLCCALLGCADLGGKSFSYNGLRLLQVAESWRGDSGGMSEANEAEQALLYEGWYSAHSAGM